MNRFWPVVKEVKSKFQKLAVLWQSLEMQADSPALHLPVPGWILMVREKGHLTLSVLR
jgi:hypothetical protein